mmetsp:Transcript_5114/g.11129  ORF Transcript_5114/g.11129 Transcript_5114/m.11129 type:complete len:99 (-) Transcript_5114:1901-2197(-)
MPMLLIHASCPDNVELVGSLPSPGVEYGSASCLPVAGHASALSSINALLCLPHPFIHSATLRHQLLTRRSEGMQALTSRGIDRQQHAISTRHGALLIV